MFSPYLRRITIDLFLYAAVGVGLYYCKDDFLDFLISLFHFGDKVNLSSLAYIIQRTLIVLVPLILLTPKLKVTKVGILKVIYYIVGICYFAGSTWIISYLVANSFSAEAFSNLWFGSMPVWFGNEVTTAASKALYAFQYDNAYVFNYIMWDSYNLFGVIFSILMGILFIRFANRLSGSKRRICKRYMLIIIMAIILPWLNNILIDKEFFFTELWRDKNVLVILSWILTYVSFKLSTISRIYWNDLFG